MLKQFPVDSRHELFVRGWRNHEEGIWIFLIFLVIGKLPRKIALHHGFNQNTHFLKTFVRHRIWSLGPFYSVTMAWGRWVCCACCVCIQVPKGLNMNLEKILKLSPQTNTKNWTMIQSWWHDCWSDTMLDGCSTFGQVGRDALYWHWEVNKWWATSSSGSLLW
jgi:hypothetical protein